MASDGCIVVAARNCQAKDIRRVGKRNALIKDMALCVARWPSRLAQPSQMRKQPAQQRSGARAA